MNGSFIILADWQDFTKTDIIELLELRKDNIEPIAFLTLNLSSENHLDKNHITDLIKKNKVLRLPHYFTFIDDVAVHSESLIVQPVPQLTVISECFSMALQSYENFDFTQSATWFNRVLNLDPNHKEAMFNLASILHMHDLANLSLYYIERILTIDSNDMICHTFLWSIANIIEMKEITIEIYQRLSQNNDIKAAHKLATLTGQGILASKCNPLYVRSIYDDMGDRFETKLVKHLNYKGPWIIYDMIKNSIVCANNYSIKKNITQCKLLDLGCGSGLFGRIFSQASQASQQSQTSESVINDPKTISDHNNYIYENNDVTCLLDLSPASAEINKICSFRDLENTTSDHLDAIVGLNHRIYGCDISKKMTEIAISNGGYDVVICGDLVSTMECLLKRQVRFDIIVAADTFIYVGVLGKVFRLVSELLRCNDDLSKEKLFAFSVEDLQEEDGGLDLSDELLELDSDGEVLGAIPGWGGRLLASARFAHSHRYVEALCRLHGFGVVAVQRAPLRLEGAVVQPGIFYLLQPL